MSALLRPTCLSKLSDRQVKLLHQSPEDLALVSTHSCTCRSWTPHSSCPPRGYKGASLFSLPLLLCSCFCFFCSCLLPTPWLPPLPPSSPAEINISLSDLLRLAFGFVAKKANTGLQVKLLGVELSTCGIVSVPQPLGHCRLWVFQVWVPACSVSFGSEH